MLSLALAGGASLFEIDARWIPLAISAIIGLPFLTLLIASQLGYLRPKESARDKMKRLDKESEENLYFYQRHGIRLPDGEP